MSRVSACFFVLFVFSIALFGDCEDNINTPNDECDAKNIIPGSDETKLSTLEKSLQKFPNVKNILKKFGKKNTLQSKNERSYGKIQDELKRYMRAVFPGTRWCGDGDNARSEDDLGYFSELDACCREHDNCQYNIIAGESKANLKNNGIFTKSACACDFKFYNCLKNVGKVASRVESTLASQIGKTYFNMLQPQCFDCICPAKTCDPNKDETKCMDNQCDKYQWISNEKFI